MNQKKLCLILPSIAGGGMERVMTQLSFYFAAQQNLELTLIILTRGEHFYELPAGVKIIEPDFRHTDYSRVRFTWKTLRFLRATLKTLQPHSVLTFGGAYNAFVLLAAAGLGLNVFISDRSRPGISYGRLLDVINPMVYKWAKGMIVQTSRAKMFYTKSVGHSNIRVIGNPIRTIEGQHPKKNIILNVGRFIPSKNQSLLVEHFAQVNDGNWKLVFVGDGKMMSATKKRVSELGLTDVVEFIGATKDVDTYYAQSKIFAFTSSSEGFPNALGEAMAAGLACISYDCVAGPADLIDHGINGLLITEKANDEYVSELRKLMNDENLRQSLGSQARLKMSTFNEHAIGKQFLDFILS